MNNSPSNFKNPAIVRCEECQSLQFVKTEDIKLDSTEVCYGDCSDSKTFPTRTFDRIYVPKEKSDSIERL